MSYITQALEENNIKSGKEGAKKLYLFCELLRKWNKTHSLTTLKTDEEYGEAIIDSIYPLTFLQEFGSCLDIGSGAGFPAMPLAILKKEANFTLCEPLSKKYGFLQFAKIELGLSNVTIKKNRVEELTDESFELITSRAVTDSFALMELSKKLLSADGQWLFYKGEQTATDAPELNAKVYQKNKRRYLLIRKEPC